jgi:tRNA dimethylallyltransferase
MEMNPSGDKVRLKVVVVGGPTASGKSELAVRLAERFDGEVVNADSMQFYRKMDIGTAKPSPDLLKRAPHHLLGIVDPDVNFTAADFQQKARQAIIEIHGRGRLPVLVGGTGLYIKAVLSGLSDSPGADKAAREEYNRIANRYGNEALLEFLREVDPVSAARIHANNRVRIIRALEVFKQTGRTLSSFQDDHGFMMRWCDSLKIALHVERSELYDRINARVDRMIADGLVAEVESLLSMGYAPELKALSAIGYHEISGYLAGKQTLFEAVELIKRNTRRYAKRQLTWFNSDPEVSWFCYPDAFDEISAAVTRFLAKK